MEKLKSINNWLLNLPQPIVGDKVRWGIGLSDAEYNINGETEIMPIPCPVMAIHILERNGIECYWPKVSYG